MGLKRGDIVLHSQKHSIGCSCHGTKFVVERREGVYLSRMEDFSDKPACNVDFGDSSTLKRHRTGDEQFCDVWEVDLERVYDSTNPT